MSGPLLCQGPLPPENCSLEHLRVLLTKWESWRQSPATAFLFITSPGRIKLAATGGQAGQGRQPSPDPRGPKGRLRLKPPRPPPRPTPEQPPAVPAAATPAQPAALGQAQLASLLSQLTFSREDMSFDLVASRLYPAVANGNRKALRGREAKEWVGAASSESARLRPHL